MEVGLLCSCEKVAHGDLGPVQPNERLGRVVTSPNHIKSNGELKPGLFPPKHLAETGLSLLRVEHMSAEKIGEACMAVAASKPGETPLGLRLCRTDILRGISGASEVQSLCVVDDPVIGDPVLPDNPAHAIAIRSCMQDGPEILRIRLELLDLFGPVTKAADVH